MIKDAEENANLDKSKKSLITIIYELDNFFIKAEKFLEISKSSNQQKEIKDLQDLENIEEIEEIYFTEILNKVKTLYSQKKLIECSAIIRNDLKNAINVLRAKYLFLNTTSVNKIIDTDFQQDN
jgi:ABC-type uncharacterized transport system substrate-binding protein